MTNTRKVVVIPGDDAAPEAMTPVVDLVSKLVPERFLFHAKATKGHGAGGKRPLPASKAVVVVGDVDHGDEHPAAMAVHDARVAVRGRHGFLAKCRP